MRRAVPFLVLLAVGLEACVSANLLTVLGVPYVTEGGLPLVKIHPGTYVLLMAALARCGPAWNAPRIAWALGFDNPGLIIFLAGVALCLGLATLTSGAGSQIVLIDSFLPAGLLAWCLAGAPPSLCRRVRGLLLALCLLNAAVAVGEIAAHQHLVPLYLRDAEYHEIPSEFRPTGLTDHPLTGAALSMLGLFAALGSSMGMLARSAFVTAMLFALLIFGGRVALGVTMVVSLLAFGRAVALRAMRRQVCLVPAIWQATAVFTIGSVLVFVALETDLAERLAGHLFWDASAAVRVQQWAVLDELDTQQWLFGCRREDLIAILTQIGLQVPVGVIENFWLLLFVDLGVFGFVPFLVAMAGLVWHLWRRASGWHLVAIPSFFVVASASNSLGRKSTLLVLLVAVVLSRPSQRAALRQRACQGRRVAAAFGLTSAPDGVRP